MRRGWEVIDSLCVVSCVVEGGVSDVSRRLTEMLTSRTTSERSVVVSPSALHGFHYNTQIKYSLISC